jgi:hypothetical protein
VHRIEAARCFAQVALGDDGISTVHGFRPVPGQLHRDRPRHSGALEVANRRPPEVVRNPTRPARGLARRLPRAAEVTDALAVPVEDVRHDHATPTLDRVRHCAGRRGARAALSLTGRRAPRRSWSCRVESDGSRLEIDLPPLQREHLGRHAPSRAVGKGDDGSQSGGEGLAASNWSRSKKPPYCSPPASEPASPMRSMRRGNSRARGASGKGPGGRIPEKN